MSPNSILALWITVFFSGLLLELALIFLNEKNIKSNSAAIPEKLRGLLSGDVYRRSVEYSLAKSRFGTFSLLYESAISLVLVLGGFFGVFDSLTARLSTGPYTHGILFVLSLSFVSSILGLPLAWYGTFRLEERFGFNRTTLRTWVLDLLKGALVSVLLLTPLLAGLFWFMAKAGALWWLYAFIFFAAFQLFIMFVYPVWIAPIFNKFSPLEEGTVRTGIVELAKKLEFENSGIFVMDGSRRSAHGNAYFTGFGKNRRIVLFDTLIKNLKQHELLAVLAHEIGHQKKGHIKKMVCISLLAAVLVFYFLSLVVPYEPFYRAFGLSSPSYHGAVVVFMFALSPLGIFLSPFGNMLSRRFEYEADRYSAAAMGEGQSLSEALLSLSRDNLSNLTPHPLYSFFHYSHPTLLERLRALEA